MKSSMFLSHLRLSVLVCGLFLLGCEAKDPGPSEARKTQESALKDPYSYGPDAKSMQKAPGKYDDVDPTDISGGGTTELNKRALKRDWDVLMGN